MKRSNAPVFWLMFGAGGMLAALFGPALVFLTGFAAPLGWPFGAEFMSYARMHAFAQNWFAKMVLCAVVSLFAWHAVHRIFHSLHDVGIGQDVAVRADDESGAQRLGLEFPRPRLRHEAPEKFIERVVLLQIRDLGDERAAHGLAGADIDDRRTLLLDEFREIRQLRPAQQGGDETDRN